MTLDLVVSRGSGAVSVKSVKQENDQVSGSQMAVIVGAQNVQGLFFGPPTRFRSLPGGALSPVLATEVSLLLRGTQKKI